MANDTNYYLLALAEFQKDNPRKRRATDLTPQELSGIVCRAQELKDAAKENHAEVFLKASEWIGEDDMERSRR